MGTPGIIIPCYEPGGQSWMPFGAKRLAQFQGISGESTETILTELRHWYSDTKYLNSVKIVSFDSPLLE